MAHAGPSQRSLPAASKSYSKSPPGVTNLRSSASVPNLSPKTGKAGSKGNKSHQNEAGKTLAKSFSGKNVSLADQIDAELKRHRQAKMGKGVRHESDDPERKRIKDKLGFDVEDRYSYH